MRNCFVPWCDYECRANPKRMMFNAPKDEKLFKKWSDVLPKKRVFKKSDKICERHFTPSDISTTFDHVINGELFKMARGRPKLNENVIPSRNFPENIDEIKPVKRGRRLGSKKIKSQSQVIFTVDDIKNNQENCKSDDNSASANNKKIRSQSQVIFTIDDIKNNQENCKSDDNSTNNEELKSDDNSTNNEVMLKYVDVLIPIEVKEKNKIQKPELDERFPVSISNVVLKNEKIIEDQNEKIDELDKSNEDEEIQDMEFFENIYEDIFEVVLPSTLWGIHRDQNKEFIAFSYYDPILRTTTKIVELTNKAILKVIMCNKIVTEQNYYSEITFDTITNILNETDQARICKMAMDNIELCQIKLVNTALSEEYCQMCSQLRYC